ncbi:flavin-containing monooxygenase [Microbacterium sp. No. 7]|uniref:flavin-containing monooxygenase n=1 Tax=Microbacterium sp. No. 7 TaxID=1714373 RepID=UPI0006D0C27D|nr:NAD(P)/FAD-dependent oxidoreductase [Microbacterium sp. No. 7]ALJ21963.1 steroid monooxygenase [Microbacterium sp. No. 7]
MSESAVREIDVDVIVIGAGVIGLYELHQLRERGFSVTLLEAGDGVGGVWYWNRYPSCRFDSESYTYGYIFDRELFHDWRWSEHFVTRVEIEKYFNHVVDRYDMRKDIRLGQRVDSAVYDEATGTWTVTTEKGLELTARFVIAATGGLSYPHYPELEGIDDFRGIAYHTGAWPDVELDFTGKRVAIIGNGPSGAQTLPAIVDQVEYVDLYQRTPTWVTPLNNRPITEEEQVELRENFDRIAETLMSTVSGFLHEFSGRYWADETPEQRQQFFEEVWTRPGFGKLTMNYLDLTTNTEANADFCRFLADKVRSIVADPWTAEHLIPKDHLYGAKRPPFVTGYLEAFNNPAASLVDLQETPIVRVTETGIETTAGHREYDIIVYATGFDFGTGQLTRMGVKGRGLDLSTDWADGPSTYLGLSAHGLPNFFLPGGPHGAGGGNYPRYGQHQADFINRLLVEMRERGATVFEPTQAHQDAWMEMVETLAPTVTFSKKHSHYYGANVAGKPAKYLMNPGGRAKLLEFIDELVASDYEGVLTTPDKVLATA